MRLLVLVFIPAKEDGSRQTHAVSTESQTMSSGAGDLALTWLCTLARMLVPQRSDVLCISLKAPSLLRRLLLQEHTFDGLQASHPCSYQS